jgi:hypothetical protein
LSDRNVHAATLEERTDDIRAVMDAAHSEPGTSCQPSLNSPVAIPDTSNTASARRTAALPSPVRHPTTLRLSRCTAPAADQLLVRPPITPPQLRRLTFDRAGYGESTRHAIIASDDVPTSSPSPRRRRRQVRGSGGSAAAHAPSPPLHCCPIGLSAHLVSIAPYDADGLDFRRPDGRQHCRVHCSPARGVGDPADRRARAGNNPRTPGCRTSHSGNRSRPVRRVGSLWSCCCG